MKKSELVKIIKEAIASKKILKEEKSLDQLMTDLGDAILADDSEAMKVAGKALLSMAKGKISQGASKLKSHLEKRYTDESINEIGSTPERRVYDAVEDLVERALSVIERYKGSAESDQSGDMGLFHDVEVALEEVLDFLIYTQKPDVDESAPSAGMTAKEKSAVVKKAKAGKDIGKKGPGFAKVEKAAEKKYGSKEVGQKVAAAAMWKAQAKK